MKCPIFINAMIQTGRTDVAGETPCLQEDCAWWDDSAQQCSIKTVCEDIFWLRTNFTQLVKLVKEGRLLSGKQAQSKAKKTSYFFSP